MSTSTWSSEDVADEWLATGSLQTVTGLGQPRAYPKRSDVRRAEARATTRRTSDRRPAGGRPPGGAAGTQRPPAPARTADSTRRPYAQSLGSPRLPIAVSPTPSVLPIRQTSSRFRPAGIDLAVPAGAAAIDAFHQPSPPTAPMVPIAIPLITDHPAATEEASPPPMAPPELAAPLGVSVDPALWGLDLEAAPATGRRRGTTEVETSRRSRRPQSPATVPISTRLLGKGRSGAARLLVLALVVGAEGVAVTSMAGTARTIPHDANTTSVDAFAYTTTHAAAAVPPTALEHSPAAAAAQLNQTNQTNELSQPGGPALIAPADAKAFALAQQTSSKAMVAAALAQAKAAAVRVQAAAARRDEAMRNAQRNPKAVAELLLADRGWGAGQFSCLVSLWNRESMWNYRAYNASSGAYGIPQALPGGKMASMGADWRTNPVTQIRWGLSYIAGRYGTPCGAWGHSQATGWY